MNLQERALARIGLIADRLKLSDGIPVDTVIPYELGRRSDDHRDSRMSGGYHSRLVESIFVIFVR